MINETGGTGAGVYAVMTGTDWFGLAVTVAVFFLMIGAYVYVFGPSRKAKLESHKYIIMNEDKIGKEGSDG